MRAACWLKLMAATKVTVTVCSIFLLGIGIDKLSRRSLDCELRALGSFEHPQAIMWINEPMTDDIQPLYLDPFMVKPYRNRTDMAQLPKLAELKWPTMVYANKPAGSVDARGLKFSLPRPFEPVMSRGQIALSRRLLKVFSDLMFAHGLGDRFWMNGGTLVGSYHHHDFIPWDDDIDVLADIEIRPRIQTLLEQLKPEYETYSMYARDKLFTKLIDETQSNSDLEYSRVTSDNPWPWPFLDIGYYKVRDTVTCEYPWIPGQSACFPTAAIFPLIFRPFGTEWYPAPSDIPTYLISMYRMRSSCVTFGYSHIFEGESQVARVPCHALADRYAFMKHIAMTHAPILSNNETLSYMFIVDLERLVRKSHSGWTVIHEVRLPIKRKVIFNHTKFGVPEPRDIFGLTD